MYYPQTQLPRIAKAEAKVGNSLGIEQMEKGQLWISNLQRKQQQSLQKYL